MADKEALVTGLNDCAEKGDFEGAFKLVRENLECLAKDMQSTGIADALKKTTQDRLLLAFIETAAFEKGDAAKSVATLGTLLRLKPGVLVIAKVWGLGEVKKLDYFYRRVTVDYKTKRGHQYTFEVAADSLEFPNDSHVLVVRRNDPARIEAMIREKPADFVKLVLASYGDSALLKLERIIVDNGFVKQAAWKKFWNSARTALADDPCVVIPAKKTDPIVLRAKAEDYGEGWLTAFDGETDPKRILSAIREYVAEGKFKDAGADVKARLEARLVFAVTAAAKTDDALYARLACLVSELGFARPPAAEMRAYLWDRRRYVTAAPLLPAREVGAMISFLASDDAGKQRLLEAIPDYCFAAVCEIVSQFGDELPCRKFIAHFLRMPKAPATLVTLIVGKYEQFRDWAELPPLVNLLSHAIALGEGKQGGETLKMQNIVRRLFADVKWLEKVLSWLSPADQALFFERFQASIAWDPSTHHAIVVRMTKLVPELESHLVKAEKKREYARVTSARSYAAKKAEYLKLINVDMPENVRKIEFAKGFGDLSENAEYQYAKDEQRQLMQKQTLMQADLEAVKVTDFADAQTTEVMPGVTVVVESAAGERIFTILGEWDNDLEKNVLSSKTRVAQNMLGKKVGDRFALPAEGGSESEATIKAILPLADEIRAWMAQV